MGPGKARGVRGAERARADRGATRAERAWSPPYRAAGSRRAAGLQATQAPSSGAHSLGRPSRTYQGWPVWPRAVAQVMAATPRALPCRAGAHLLLAGLLGGGGVQVSGCVDTREGVTERPGDGCNANSFCRQEPPGKVAPRFRILRSRDQCLLSWAAQLWISCHAATDNAHIREYGESSLNNTTLSCWNGLALGPGLWGQCQRRSC